MPEDLVLNDYSDRFGAVRHSIDMLAETTSIILWGAIGAVILIFMLVVALFLHDRRGKVGIYLSLGEKRLVIILQFLSEVVVISLSGITLALFIGIAISNQLSRSILQNEMIAFFERTPPVTTQIEVFFGGEALTYEQLLEASNTNLSLEIAVVFYTVGFLIIAIATLIPIVYITMLKPKKVLL